MPLTVWLAAFAVLSAIPVLWWTVAGPRQVSAKLVRENLSAGRSVSLRAAVLEQPAGDRLLGPLLDRSAKAANRFVPASRLERIDERLSSSGLVGRFDVEQVVGVKVLLAVLPGFLLGLSVLSDPTLMKVLMLIGIVLLGWFLPDMWLSGRADRRLQTIERELPDVLDQLTISVEAGLGFEAALARVGRSRSGPLGEEIGRTMQDIQLGQRRADALDALAARAEVADVRHFVLALRQAEKMGVPLGRTLRLQADEARDKRRMRAEEKAMKLPVKMIFPLATCILPVLFIVILGPAMIVLSRGFG